MGIFADPNSRKLEFLVEVGVSGDQYQSINIPTGSPYVPVRYSYSQVWVALSPQVTYNFYNTEKLKIFAGFGLAITFHDYYNGTYDINYAATHVTNAPLKYDNFFNNQKAADFFNTISYPLVITAGVKFTRKLEVFGRYYSASTVSQNHYFQLRYDNAQIGLGYQIK